MLEWLSRLFLLQHETLMTEELERIEERGRVNGGGVGGDVSRDVKKEGVAVASDM